MKAKPNIKDYQRYQEYFEALEQWAEEAAKKIKKLGEYVQHKQHCKLFGFTSSNLELKGCTCGLKQALSQ